MISTHAVILVMFGITHVFIFLAGQWLIDPLKKSIQLRVQSKVLYFCRSVLASQTVLRTGLQPRQPTAWTFPLYYFLCLFAGTHSQLIQNNALVSDPTQVVTPALHHILKNVLKVIQ